MRKNTSLKMIVLTLSILGYIASNISPVIVYGAGDSIVTDSIEVSTGNIDESENNDTESQPEIVGPDIQTVYNFYHTGEVQEFVAPFDGVYLLEAWGAEGGDNKYRTENNNGAYAKGQYKMNQGDKLYVYVGSKGQDEMSDRNSHTDVTNNGGWNGGGSGKGSGSGGGGGATDFRTEKQDVSLEFKAGSDNDKRLLVAGGGGGMSADPHYGVKDRAISGIAGGDTFGNTTYSYQWYSDVGVNKSSNASKVLTESNIGESASTYIYGGGGGYNGGKSYPDSSVAYTKGIGGLSSTRGVGAGTELTGVQDMPHPAGGTVIGNSGHGYAKITLLNNAPELVISNTFRDNMEVTANQKIIITGTIKDEISNNMMVYYQLDDGEPVKLFSAATSSEPVFFEGTLTLPSDLSSGKHILRVWSEDDADAIGKTQEFNLYYITYDIEEIFNSIKLTPNTWTKETVNIEMSVDEKYPIEKVILPNNSSSTEKKITYPVTTNGNYLFKVQATNGIFYEKIVTVENIDKTVPTVNYTLDKATATVSNVIINIEASDTQSGVAEIIAPDGSIIKDKTSFEYEVNRNDTYRFVVKDKVGNTTTKDIVVNNIDKEAPTLTLTKNTSNVAKEVQITANASSVAGIEKIILPDGKAVYASSATFKAIKNGDYTFRAINKAGLEIEQTITIDHIDSVLPTATIEYNESWTNEALIVRIVANDDIKISNIRMPNGSIVNDSYGVYTITANGTYTFTVTDSAGNVLTKTIEITNIDKEAPTYTSNLSPSTWTNKDVMIYLNVFDKGIGIDKVILPDGSETSESRIEYPVSENKGYIFKAIDKLGNQREISIIATNIDKEKPTLQLNVEEYGGNFRFTTYMTDTQSGIEGYPAGDIGYVVYISPNGEIFKAGMWGARSSLDLPKNQEKYNGEWTIRASDIAGNITEIKENIDVFDSTKPTLTLTVTNIEIGKKMITAIAEDKTGIRYIKTPDGKVNYDTTFVTYTVTANGTYTFETSDTYGNITKESITIGDIGDNNTEIALSLSTEDWTNSDVVITAKVINPLAPIKYIKLPNGNMVKAEMVTYVVKENGAYVFEAEDELNLTYQNAIVVSNIDKGKPIIEIINETEWTNENVEVTINAEDR